MKIYFISSILALCSVCNAASGDHPIKSFFSWAHLNFCTRAFSEVEPTLKVSGWRPMQGEGRPEHWPIDGPARTAEDYEATLSEILSKTGDTVSKGFFNRFLRTRRRMNQPNHVLDLFGSGFFVENTKLADSITGMRWGPYDRAHLPNGFTAEKMPKEILGDIFNTKTWSKLDTSMKERSISKMDLVTMIPVGGWENTFFYESMRAEPNILALKFIIENVLLRLSPDGRFYFEINVPLLTGALSEHPLLQELKQKISETTPYRLELVSKLSHAGATYKLSGALLPAVSHE